MGGVGTAGGRSASLSRCPPPRYCATLLLSRQRVAELLSATSFRQDSATALRAASGASASAGPASADPQQHAADGASPRGRFSKAERRRYNRAKQAKQREELQQGLDKDARETARAVTRAIASCASWQAVSEALHQHQHQLNHIHVAALLTQLARLAAERPPELHEVTEHARLLAHVHTLVSQHAAAMRPQELAGTLHAMARLSSPAPSKQLVVSLMVECYWRLADFSPQGLTMLLWALPALGIQRLRPDWEGKLYAALQQRLPHMDSRHLCMVLRSLAHLGAKPPAALLEQIVEAHVASLASAAAAAAAAAAGATQRGDSSASGGGSSGTAGARAGGGGSVHAAAGVLPHTVSLALWALGRLGHRPPRAQLQPLLAAAQAMLPAASPQELANCLWGLAKLDAPPPAAWMASFYAASLALMPVFGPQALSNTLYSLAKLRQQPGAAWLQAAADSAAAQLPAFSGQGLANVVQAFAALRYDPGAAWLARVERHVSRQQGRTSVDLGSLDIIQAALDRMRKDGSAPSTSSSSSSSSSSRSSACHAGARQPAASRGQAPTGVQQSGAQESHVAAATAPHEQQLLLPHVLALSDAAFVAAAAPGRHAGDGHANNDVAAPSPQDELLDAADLAAMAAAATAQDTADIEMQTSLLTEELHRFAAQSSSSSSSSRRNGHAQPARFSRRSVARAAADSKHVAAHDSALDHAVAAAAGLGGLPLHQQYASVNGTALPQTERMPSPQRTASPPPVAGSSNGRHATSESRGPAGSGPDDGDSDSGPVAAAAAEAQASGGSGGSSSLRQRATITRRRAQYTELVAA